MISGRQSHLIQISLICFVWLLMILLIRPAGEFPLNDDWVYAQAVKHLIDEGEIKYNDIPAMSLVAQTLWGGLFCKLFGFSFTVLRISTLVMGLAGLIATYFLLAGSGINKKLSLAGTLIICVNPLFFSLSATFMTDIPFYTFSVLSILFFTKCFKKWSTITLVLGTLFAVLAALTRQPGVLIPVAFVVAVLVQRERVKFFYSLIPVIITAISLMAWTKWMEAHHTLPEQYGHAGNVLANLSPSILFSNLFHRGGKIIFYCSLFLVPALFFYRNSITKASRKKLWWTLGLSILLLIPVIRTWHSFPGENIIGMHGLGPQTLKDTFFLGLNSYQLFPQWVWVVIKSCAVIASFAMLLFFFIELLSAGIFKKDIHASSPKIFALAFMLIYCAFLVIATSQFDRYFIPLLPLLLVVLLPIGEFRISLPVGIAAGIVMITFMVYSVSATHDYLSWNRARWQAAHYAMHELNIPPQDIDGGYEFNGWYNTGDFTQEKSWWFAKNDNYLVTFGPVPGNNAMRSFPFSRMIGEPGNIYLLKKEQ
jgi:4-amino-4-deoxy-L-arabinose transferase-like glycosyltransferase